MNVTKDKISLRPQTTFSACRQGASRSLLCFPSEKTEDAPLLYDPPAGRQVSTSTRSARRWCTHPSATPRRPHRQLRARMAFRGNEAFDFGDILAEVDNGEVTADSSSPEHTPDAKTLETLDGKLLGGGMGGDARFSMGLGDGVDLTCPHPGAASAWMLVYRLQSARHGVGARRDARLSRHDATVGSRAGEGPASGGGNSYSQGPSNTVCERGVPSVGVGGRTGNHNFCKLRAPTLEYPPPYTVQSRVSVSSISLHPRSRDA